MSTVEYITDSRFEFIGLGFEILNHSKANGPVFIPGPDVPWAVRRLKKIFGKAFHNCTVVAKNCKFDILILLEKFGINPPFIIDIEDLSRFYDSRMSQKLKDLALMFNLEAKGDTKQFKGQHWEDMDHQAMKEYNLGDIRNENALLQILLPIVNNPEFEIPLARHTLGMYLSPHFRLDYALANNLTLQMEQELLAAVKQTGHTKKEISGTLSFTELLINVLPNREKIPVKAGKPGKNMVKLLGQPGVVPAFAKTDEGFKQLLNHTNGNVRILMQAKVASKSWPGHIKRIQSLMAQCKASNDLLRVPLKYYGAHTGRWSGTEKINVQNFGGRGRGAEVHSLIRKMRNMLIAPETETLAITDSAQIEARILAWIAGQTDLTEGFRNGEDIYSVFASRLFNCGVHKPTDNDSEEQKGILKIKRGFGKDGILGSGYGMGPVKFYLNCIVNNGLRPLFKEPSTLDGELLKKIMRQHTKDLMLCGLENYIVPESGKYDEKFIAYLILAYRTKYARIPEFWTRIEKAFRYVIKYPREVATIHIRGKTVSFKKHITASDDSFNPGFKFWKSGNTVHLQLPSGRVLNYRHAHLDKKGTIKYHWGHLWGGAITENVVQAIARDLLGYWILECEREIGPVILHSHDEIVCMVDKSEAMDKLSEMIDIFSTGPDWADGLPLSAEGQLTEMYIK